MTSKILKALPISENSQFIIEPFLKKGLKYKLVSHTEFIETLESENIPDADFDGFYSVLSNTILLCNDLSINPAQLKQVFFHEFIHMIRIKNKLAMRPFSFMSENLFKIYDKAFPLAELITGVQEMNLLTFKWREEAVCELVSYFISLQHEKIERTELQRSKPLFIYLMSGGFDDDDMLKMKEYIFKECTETLKSINDSLPKNKIYIENFENYFNAEYDISTKQVSKINEIKKTPRITKNYKQFKKRVFF